MATDPRPLVLLLLLLFMIFSPEPQPAVIARKSRVVDVLGRERHALDVTNSTFFGDFDPTRNKWLNISGFANDTGFAWTYLDNFRGKAERLTRHALGEDYDNKLVGLPTGKSLVLYNNVSGVVHGDWVRDEVLQPPKFNISVYAPDGPFGRMPIAGFGRNLTAREGRMRVRFGEPERPSLDELRQVKGGPTSNVARFVTAQVGIDATDGSNESWEVQVNGVHFQESGNMILATTSDKFFGLYGLPQLAPNPYYYRLAQRVIGRVVSETITRQSEGRQRLSSPFTSNTDGSSETHFTVPHCELLLYLQQIPLPSSQAGDGRDAGLLRVLEDELRNPTGAWVPRPREMHFSMVAFSPDCGFAIQSKGPPDYSPQAGEHLTGIKTEVEHQQARHHILFYICVLSGQLWLLTRQMKEASTPSMRSRISFYTISMFSLGDGFTTMAFALISLFIPGLWVLLIATCFLAFLSVSFFGMRFLMDIWTVQAPERERRERERRAVAAALNTAAPNPPPTINTNISADRHTTPSRILDGGAVPVIIAPDQDEPLDETPTRPAALPIPVTANAPTPPTTMGRAYSFGALYTRFYFLLLASLFLSLNATSWPPTVRRFYFTSLAFLYLSFWVPQIVRNSMRNCRRAFRWEFVIGQSLLRLSPFAYFYGYGANVLFADVDFLDLSVLAGWLWVQCLLLASQEILGPRWFVKSAWVPLAYDYHPVLHEDEEGGNLPIGTEHTPFVAAGTSASKDSPEKTSRVFDCAICMQDIEVHVQRRDSTAESGLAGAGGLLARRSYMLTPCRHIFHAKCLEGWMKFRLQCPICREDLPPL